MKKLKAGFQKEYGAQFLLALLCPVTPSMTHVPYTVIHENFPFQASWSPFSLSSFPMPTLTSFSYFISHYDLASLDPLFLIGFSLKHAPFHGFPYETLFRKFPFTFSYLLIAISHPLPPM